MDPDRPPLPGSPDPTFSVLRPSFPLGRVKKIVKLDRDIKKLSSEALLLISLSAELFLSSLVGRSADAVAAAGKRAVRLEHIRSAVRAHQPTSDFLLDCLPEPARPPKKERAPAAEAPPPPPGARRIDEFFAKAPAADAERGAGLEVT